MSTSPNADRSTLRDLPGRVRARLRGPSEAEAAEGAGHSLSSRVAALEAAVAENRKLNQRLSDLIDVVVEVLVPAADRDDARMREALDRLSSALDDGPRDGPDDGSSGG